MNRSYHFNFIEEKLNTFAYRIEGRGKLNILDLNLHSETFYAQLLNLLFHWNLVNINQFTPNAEAVDLIDKGNRRLAQVSSVASKQKIESALTKDLSAYKGHSFHFVSICKDAGKLREEKEKYKNPHDLSFDPSSDIHDVTTILRAVLATDVGHQELIAQFLRKELVVEVEPQRVESSLATVVGILARENLSQSTRPESRPFEIDQKISFNALKAARDIIVDYTIHHSRLDGIYNEFDKHGSNKSFAVLEQIRRDYFRHRDELNGDALFFRIVTQVVERIQGSANYVALPIEELELCANIIVVDAFIRCKIFESPASARTQDATP